MFERIFGVKKVMVFLNRAIRTQVFAITPLVRGGICLVRFRVRIVGKIDIRLHTQAAITEQRLFFLKPEDNASSAASRHQKS